MGVGHVPSGAIRSEGPGDDLPGRQRRRAGADHAAVAASRLRIARVGERLAERLLVERGAVILGRNVAVGADEVDLHVALGSDVVAVEVKTVSGSRLDDDPVYRFTATKARRVRRAAARLHPRAVRIDLVAVSLGRSGVRLRWIKGVAPINAD